MKKTIFAILGFLLLTGSVIAQDYAADVKSEDAIIKALYDVISGDSGQVRNWDRFLFLFAKDARLIPTNKNANDQYAYRVMTPQEYVENFSLRNPAFYEYELSRKTESYGTIVHIFTTYATKYGKNGIVNNRGINSIQLFKTQDRYYIMNIFWCSEQMGFPLPKKYLN